MADISVLEVGVTILVLKEFVGFAKFALDKLSARKNGTSSSNSVPVVALIRETHVAVKDIHTSVVAPDRVPLVSRVDDLRKGR